MAREIVYYDEQHTLMTQDVTVWVNEKILKEMLSEEISPESKRELIQTYYVCRLDQEVDIQGKHNYGDWNASIGDIRNIYHYEPLILEKLANQVTKEDLEKEFSLINNRILALSEKEDADSVKVQQAFIKALGL